MSDKSRATVLNVDDNEAKRYLVTKILGAAGYEIIEAGTGAEALRLAKNGPDVIILDVRLPDINGLDVCRQLKDDPRTASIPVLHLSATFTAPQHRVEGLDSGADGYLIDAQAPEELLATVRSLLRIRRAEDVARTLAQQWQVTFDSISDGLCVIDPSGIVQRCNRALADLFERSVEQIAGNTSLVVFPVELCAALHSNIASAIAAGGRQVAEVSLGANWYRLTVDPVSGLAPDSHAVCILSDITEQKRADKASQLLSAASVLLANLIDFESPLQRIAGLSVNDFADICTIDLGTGAGPPRRTATAIARSGTGEFFQDLQRQFGAEAAFDTPPSQVNGWLSSHLIADVSASGAASLLTPAQLELIRKFEIASLIRVPLMARNSAIGSVAFLSFRRTYDAHDLAFAQDLAQRIGISLENSRLYAEVKDADRRKDEFLAMLAHELRNPLAPIRNAIALLDSEGIDAATSRWARELMGKQVDHLVRLVDDLLDVSRITQGKIELRQESVELGSLIKQAIGMVQKSIDEQRHMLTVSVPSEPVWFRGDPVRLTQIVFNLVNNAAKYTEPGGQIWVDAQVLGTEFQIRIKDTGVGMDAELIPRVFELFTQSDRSLARSQGGLGIGLTLVRTLVGMHGGSVVASSPGPGKGSEFLVKLPLTIGETATRISESRPVPIRKLRILVVEDNIGSAKILAALLRNNSGHEVTIAHDGHSALEVAKSTLPELILMDIGLPGLNGYEAARQLRSLGQFENTILVALTGYGQEKDRLDSLAAGFDHHLVKPPSVVALEQLFSDPKLSAAKSRE